MDQRWASSRVMVKARPSGLASGFLYSLANTGTGGMSFSRL